MVLGLNLLFVSVACLVLSQIIIKTMFAIHGPVPFSGELIAYIKSLLLDFRFWIGGLTLVSGAALWYAGLSRVPLSTAFPIASLSYPLVMALAWYVLDEPVTLRMMAGSVMIFFGVMLCVVWR